MQVMIDDLGNSLPKVCQTMIYLYVEGFKGIIDQDRKAEILGICPNHDSYAYFPPLYHSARFIQ